MAESSPRFRHDLVASTAEEDGVAFVDVSDPGTGSNFRFYDYEYQLALQMDGQPVEQIVAWASATYGLDLTAEGVLEFGGRLAELGFLEARERVGAAHKAAHEAEAPRPPGSRSSTRDLLTWRAEPAAPISRAGPAAPISRAEPVAPISRAGPARMASRAPRKIRTRRTRWMPWIQRTS